MFRCGVASVLLSVAGLLAGTPSAGAADLCLDVKFGCDGFEPNWQLTTGGENKTVSFVDPENPNWETDPFTVRGCVLQGSPNDYEVVTDKPLSLTASIVGQSCIKPNEETTDFSVTVTYIQGARSGNPREVQGTGCCQMVK
jgi:hypothetical protein